MIDIAQYFQSIDLTKNASAIAAAVSAIIGLLNWRSSRFRPKLKDDLDILKRYREELAAQGTATNEIVTEARYLQVMGRVTRRMHKYYAPRLTDWSDAFASLGFAAAFLFVTLSPSASSAAYATWATAVELLCVGMACYFFYEAFFARRFRRWRAARANDASVDA